MDEREELATAAVDIIITLLKNNNISKTPETLKAYAEFLESTKNFITNSNISFLPKEEKCSTKSIANEVRDEVSRMQPGMLSTDRYGF